MTKLRQGAWVNAADGRFAYVDEHANWAKRPGNLQSLGMPPSVWESIRDIPSDYGGENRKRILLAVMGAGGIRMRGHGDVVVFEFTVDAKVALPACRDVLRQIAGELTLCRFNNLTTTQTVEVSYADYVAQVEDATQSHRQRP
jgi:hypothetical protein